MGIFSRFEGHVEDGIEGAANKMFDAPISPVQISKKAEKAMRREKMVGAGRQYAPTLYTVLVNPDDDARLFGYYPTLAGETETYLAAKAAEDGLAMDGQPLVRFIVDEELRHGKFDIIAEMVSAPIVAQLRQEEMARYGLAPQPGRQQNYAPQQGYGRPQQAQQAPRRAQQGYAPYNAPAPQQAPAPGALGYDDFDVPAPKEPLPYVPEEEIDRSIDYGEYTFNSQDFESYEKNGPSQNFTPATAGRETYGRRESLPLDRDLGQPAPAAPDMSGLDVNTYDPNIRPSMPLSGTPGAPQRQSRPVSRPTSAGTLLPARLVNTATNRAYTLAKSPMVLGRSSASDVIVDDINASRNHAELAFNNQGFWTITDLGSTNGTYVNGQRVGTAALSEGDRISCGMTDLVFTVR